MAAAFQARELPILTGARQRLPGNNGADRLSNISEQLGNSIISVAFYWSICRKQKIPVAM